MSSSARSGAIFTSSGTRRQRRDPPVGGVQRLADRGQHRPQRADRLEVAQARRVRRADVDHHVVGQPASRSALARSPPRRLLLGTSLVLPMLTPRAAPRARRPRQADTPRPWLLKPSRLISARYGRRGTCAASGIARLRLAGERADLDEREAQRVQLLRAHGVLVEARRQSQRSRQIQPQRANSQHRITGAEPRSQQPGNPGHGRRGPDQREPGPVRGLGRHAPEHHGEQQPVHRPPTISAGTLAGRAPGAPRSAHRAQTILPPRPSGPSGA